MPTRRHLPPGPVLLVITVAASLLTAAARADQVLEPAMRHLRSGDAREWAEFAERAEGKELVVRFDARSNATGHTLRVRHRDLKQTWDVRLNGRSLGKLPTDENEMTTCLAVPPDALRDGANELRIAAGGGASDDVLIGEVRLLDRPLAAVLSEATMDVEVTDDRKAPVPCRITIADERGGLVPLGNASDGTSAVRTGVVYTADGRARLKLPAGRYTVYAGRGFEYSLASAEVDLRPGDSAQKALSIRRVVPTEGYVSCDTHVHTLTYSRHGDATVEERVLTIAGEGVELPVAAEHNLQIDYAKAAEAMNVRRHFTPLMGNEVTTQSLGHFNVFPIDAGKNLINWRVRDWETLSRNIADITNDPVIVLNHARDVHGGFRPFDRSRHLSLTGQGLDGRTPPANAMEVINSGATRNDPTDLFRDWFGMLNRGHKLTPVGSSDSHDVSRYIVGQGRTYVRCDDADPGRIDVEQARRSLREGRVLVSYGLLADITVDGRFGPGDLVSSAGDLAVIMRVLGPEWTRASRVDLFANGVKVWGADIATPFGQSERTGVKWEGRHTLPNPAHDIYLVAIATGPGITQPYWPTAKPYQPTSIEWKGYVLGATGAVWIDADRSGRFDSAFDYASRIVGPEGADIAAVVRKLADYDEAVAAQAAGILCQRSPERFGREFPAALKDAAPATRRGFEAFWREWEAR